MMRRMLTLFAVFSLNLAVLLAGGFAVPAEAGGADLVGVEAADLQLADGPALPAPGECSGGKGLCGPQIDVPQAEAPPAPPHAHRKLARPGAEPMCEGLALPPYRRPPRLAA